MPQLQPQQFETLVREMQRQLRDQERRIFDLEGRRRLTLDRGVQLDVPAPGEGEVLIEAATEKAYYWANGYWRPFGGIEYNIKVFSDRGVLTTGDGKFIFAVSDDIDGMNLVDADAYVTTVSSSGTPTIQIRNVTQAADMLSTRITIDASEFTSYTAATPPVIDLANDDVAKGDRIAIDVDVAGTGAKGLGVILEFAFPI